MSCAGAAVPLARAGRLAPVGQWMQRNGAAIRAVQWVVVAVYAILILVPAFTALPGDTAHLWNNLTLAAQFVFWGIWWPFVLLSMVLLGRVWCGVLCPEGTLTEFASRFGRGRAIPRWMRWGGWPFVAFCLTTIYGQMVSVYQYPKAVLLVLGGSTAAAIVVGYLYGREKRVWCRFLCPVNGVFALLARLAPLHYKVDEAAWRRSYTEGEHGARRVIPINCAPLVPLRNMKGAAACHMCGRCSGHRDAIALSARSASEEVVEYGAQQGSAWDTALIVYGLLGIAIGAFHWTGSPWFVDAKQFAAGWLIDHNVLWPLDTDHVPWYLLTHYPDRNDVFSWLDGAMLVGYILATGLVWGTGLLALLAAATRIAGRFTARRLHHLAQALIPLAGAGVFLGLSATTLALLRSEHFPIGWAADVRICVLVGANVWSAWLAARVLARMTGARWFARAAAFVPFLAALAWVDYAWWLMFWGWAGR